MSIRHMHAVFLENNIEHHQPLFTAIGSTKCLDITGGLEMSAISIKPTISKSETYRTG